METSMVLSIVWVTFLGLGAIVLYCFPEAREQKPETYSVAGDLLNSIGKVLAVATMLLSWSVNQSIWWAFVHGTMPLLYLIYYGLGYGH